MCFTQLFFEENLSQKIINNKTEMYLWTGNF